MKQLVLMISMGISAIVWGQSTNAPRIKFVSDNINLGNINENGGSVTETFKFVNTGKKPLKVLSVLTSCGCTTPDWTRTEVKTGDTGRIVTVFNPKGKDGNFFKNLTVITNGDPQNVIISIEGAVYSTNKERQAMFPHQSGNLLMSVSKLELPAQKEDKVDTFWVGLFNDGPDMLFINKIGTPGMIKADPEKAVLKSQSGVNIMLTYDGKLAKGLGTFIDTIYLGTSDKIEPTKILPVKAKIVQNFDNLTPEQLANAPALTLKQTDGDIGQLYQGETGTFTFEVTNTGKSDLVIRKVISDCKCIQSEIPKGPIKKGAKAKVLVSYNSKGKHRNIEEKVILVANDPNHPETVLKVRAKVVIPGKEPVTY